MIGRGCCALLLAFWLAVGSATADEYDFDIPEAEPSPRELGGRLEGRYLYRRRNPDSIRIPSRAGGTGSDRHEWRSVAELSARWRTRRFQTGLLTHHQFVHADDDRWDHEIYEARASWTPNPRLTLDAGKKRVLWGKGYAWNPVGFLNRPKDPDDPDLNLEGRVLLGLDLIRSFPEGNLNNLAVTALLLPVADDWANEDLGGAGDWNAAVKLYLLWRDTDIDFVVFDGPEQPFSLGVDFAKNLAENFEVHGELAFRNGAARRTADEGFGKTGSTGCWDFAGSMRGRPPSSPSITATGPDTTGPGWKPFSPLRNPRFRRGRRPRTRGGISGRTISISKFPRRSPSAFWISPHGSPPSSTCGISASRCDPA